MATVLSGGKSYALRGADEIRCGNGSSAARSRRSSIDWVQQFSIQAVWTALIVGFLWLVLNRHRFGEHTLFIGDFNDVSRVVGIDVDREKIKIFTLMGVLAAVAAIMLTLENKNFFGNQGQGYLLTAIASVLIGGTSIFGGQATVIGTVFGCFIIGMIEAGLVATGLTGAWVRTVQGLIFLTAIIFYLYVDEPQRRAALMVDSAHCRDSAARPPRGPALPNEGLRFAFAGGRGREDREQRTCVFRQFFLSASPRRRWLWPPDPPRPIRSAKAW